MPEGVLTHFSPLAPWPCGFFLLPASFLSTQVTSEQAVEHLEKLKPGMDFADVEELIHTGLFGGSEGLFWWLGATVGVALGIRTVMFHGHRRLCLAMGKKAKK